MSMSEALDEAMGWRNDVDMAHDTLDDRVTALKALVDKRPMGYQAIAEQRVNVIDMVSYLEDDVYQVGNAIPCEGGVRDFVDNLGNQLEAVLENYLPYDDVALTHYDWEVSDRYTFDDLQISSWSDIAELLGDVLDNTTMFGTRAAIKALAEALADDEFNNGDTADAYVPPKEGLAMRFRTVSA